MLNVNREYQFRIDEIKVEKKLAGKWQQSFLQKLQFNDVSQMSSHVKSDLYQDIISFLNDLKDESIIKFYKENSEILFSSKEDLGVEFAKQVTDIDYDDVDFLPNSSSKIFFKDDYLVINDKYISFLKIDSLPNSTYSNILEEFGEDYFICLRKRSKLKSESFLRQKMSSSDQFARTYHKNHGAEKAYIQASNIMGAVDEQEESLYNWEGWIKVSGYSKAELEFNIGNVLESSKKLRIKLYRECSLLDIVYNKYLAGNFYSFTSDVEVSSYVANLIPTFQEQIHAEGVRLESPTCSSLSFNLFDKNEGNPHLEITGSSGSGKTCFGAYLAFEHHRIYGVNLIFVDMLGGLKRMSRYLNGQEISTQINPMIFGKDIDFLKNFIVSVIGESELSRKDIGHIYGKIQEWIELDNMGHFIDLIDFLELEIGEIKCYFNEVLQYLSEESMVDLPKVAYVDLAKIPCALLDSYLIYVRALADRMSGKSIILWDECWQIVDKAPHFLEYAFKVDRKKSICNMILNQEKHSFKHQNEKLAKIIESSANFEVIYKQGDLSSDLSSVKNDFYSTLGYKKDFYSDALLFSKSSEICKVIRVKPYNFFYQLTFTDDKARWKQQEMFLDKRSMYVDYKQAFSEWIEHVSSIGAENE